jgi:hypothetical protein
MTDDERIVKKALYLLGNNLIDPSKKTVIIVSNYQQLHKMKAEVEEVLSYDSTTSTITTFSNGNILWGTWENECLLRGRTPEVLILYDVNENKNRNLYKSIEKQVHYTVHGIMDQCNSHVSVGYGFLEKGGTRHEEQTEE